MAFIPLGKCDPKVKVLLPSGNPRYATVSKLKIAPKTVYNIVEKLVHGGYIRHRMHILIL